MKMGISPDRTQIEKRAGERWRLDRRLTLYPIIIIAMAMSFDVGSFAIFGMSFYSFFSLTEHLMFALEALPLVLAASCIALVLLPPVTSVLAKKWKYSTPIEKIAFIVALPTFAALSISPAVYSVYVTYMQWQSLLPALALILLLLLPPALSVLSAHKAIRPRLVPPLGVYLALASSFAAGVGYNGVMMNAPIETPQASVAFKDEDRPRIQARLVRSGERGLLMYDPASRLLRFERWDGIRSVEKSPP